MENEDPVFRFATYGLQDLLLQVLFGEVAPLRRNLLLEKQLMNCGNMQKTILCYGDSNTWGFVPGGANYKTMYRERYARNVRWPGFLQNLLGNDYYVVEEGLNGRTTNLDYKFPPDRNGKRYLSPCLYSHAPINVVILSLGGNDLKAYFKRSAIDVCGGLSELVDIIKISSYGHKMQEAPKILIISQLIPLPISEKFVDDEGILIFEGAIERSKLLVELYSDLAKKAECYFLNISNDIRPSEIDGMHLDKNGHEKLAMLVKNKINSIF